MQDTRRINIWFVVRQQQAAIQGVLNNRDQIPVRPGAKLCEFG